MVPHITAVRLSGRADRAELPLLVLGPSLGTSAGALWAACAAGLDDAFDLLAWDLPGHGHNRSVPDEAFTMAELAAGVLAIVDEVQHQREDPGRPFHYAGVSVGGAVGLQLLLDAPERVVAAALLCTGARIGSEASWAGRIGQVSVSGTAVLVEGSAERWFGPGFLEREPDVARGLLRGLEQTQDDGYLRVCEALATFDVRDRLGEVATPVLAVAGGHDPTTPPEGLREIADGVRHGVYAELDGVAHLAPVEAPAAVVALLRQHFLGETPDSSEFADDLERLVTQHVEGDLWTRPGLDRRSRSLVALAALVAGGHHEELAVQLRAARSDGVTVEEIRELLLQTAVHCGVPAARAAARVAQRVLAEPEEPR